MGLEDRAGSAAVATGLAGVATATSAAGRRTPSSPLVESSPVRRASGRCPTYMPIHVRSLRIRSGASEPSKLTVAIISIVDLACRCMASHAPSTQLLVHLELCGSRASCVRVHDEHLAARNWPYRHTSVARMLGLLEMLKNKRFRLFRDLYKHRLQRFVSFGAALVSIPTRRTCSCCWRATAFGPRDATEHAMIIVTFHQAGF